MESGLSISEGSLKIAKMSRCMKATAIQSCSMMFSQKSDTRIIDARSAFSTHTGGIQTGQLLRRRGEMKSVEIFLNFMVMDMNMNVLWKNPSGVAPAQIERMNRFWGDGSWREAAYRQEDDLFGPYEEKTGNEDVAE